MPNKNSLPEWEQVLSAAAHLQQLLPGAVLVGGTASAIHAAHQRSRDADHALTDLRTRFEEVLTELEVVAGWKTSRIQRPVQMLGRLDEYKALAPKWQKWSNVKEACARFATAVFDSTSSGPKKSGRKKKCRG